MGDLALTGGWGRGSAPLEPRYDVGVGEEGSPGEPEGVDVGVPLQAGAAERAVDGSPEDVPAGGRLVVDEAVGGAGEGEAPALHRRVEDTGGADVTPARDGGVVECRRGARLEPDDEVPAAELHLDDALLGELGGPHRHPPVAVPDADDALFDGEAAVDLPVEQERCLAVKERVIGIRDGDRGVAVRTTELAEEGVVEVELGAQDLVVWLQPGTASALDDATVSGGRDVGATGVFDPAVDGRRLTFTRTADGFVDDQTGSRWDVLGRAVDGPLRGTTLEAYTHVDTFWFAWAAFLPGTDVVPELGGS